MNPTERQTLLAIDFFALQHAEAFRTAFETVASLVFEISADEVISTYEIAIRCGDYNERSILETMPRICAALIITVYGHLAIGAPLYLDAHLLLLWALDSTRQCRACGYRQPATLERCKPCGGEVGEIGCFEARRARNAAQN